jgi:hypothetical protein
MERLGLGPGQDFDLAGLAPVARKALEQAVPYAQRRMTARQKKLATLRNGWQVITEGVGAYGVDYLRRATVDLIGLGANLPEDAVYPICYVDALGEPFTGAKGFQVANSLDRFAIGDRDDLVYGADGSLDLHIQHQPPAPEDEANWLPAPAGVFNLCLRLYYPKGEVLDGRWAPPEVEPVEQ